MGATITILSSVLPHSLELVALRPIDIRVFGIRLSFELLSFEPAVSALAGLLILGEAMGPLEVGGMGWSSWQAHWCWSASRAASPLWSRLPRSPRSADGAPYFGP